MGGCARAAGWAGVGGCRLPAVGAGGGLVGSRATRTSAVPARSFTPWWPSEPVGLVGVFCLSVVVNKRHSIRNCGKGIFKLFKHPLLFN